MTPASLSSSGGPHPIGPAPWSRRQFLRATGGLSLVTLAVGPETRSQGVAHGSEEHGLENERLRITLTAPSGAVAVFDKRTGLTWHQPAVAGFAIAPGSVLATPVALSAQVDGPQGALALTLTLDPQRPHAFELSVAVTGRRYTFAPGYPAPFHAPGPGWHYVQNTVGEGMLMPLDRPADIVTPYGWNGGQPWWGLTDLKRAMRARLESFATVDGVFASPLRIHYAFFPDGGYVGLAKEFRSDFLRAHPEMRPLRERTQARPAVAYLQDSVYVYLWGQTPAEDLHLVTQMKAAGIDRGIAVTYGRHEIDRASCDGIRKLGWVVGRYQMPTGNRFKVYKRGGYAKALVEGRLSLRQLINPNRPDLLERLCTQAELKVWPAKARSLIDDYGLQLFYFDTMAVQVVACVHPDHPESVEANTAGRLEIMQRTRDLGMVVGSGEGLCPTWALPGVDFFEGQMNLRDYHNSTASIPSGGYAEELGEGYADGAATQLDPVRRIPLYQLAFHDFVVGTWVWRDTNFQSTPYAWKKDLFNILYGSMPMWHITQPLWDRHHAAMVASYRKIAAVRQRIGFAEMMNHGWLTDDRLVQFTDWSTGDRVVVNFGERPFEREAHPAVPARSFVMEAADSSIDRR